MGLYAFMLDRLTGDPITSGVTAKVSKDGGATAASTNSPTHLSDGLWWLLLTAAETDAKQVAGVFIHASGVHALGQVSTVAVDPDNANNMGLVALPGLAPGGANGLPLVSATSGGFILSAEEIFDHLAADSLIAGSIGKKIADSFVQTGDVFALLGTPVNVTFAAELAALGARVPTALSSSGNILADVRAIADNVTSADNLSEATRCIATGIVDSGSTNILIIPASINPAIIAPEQLTGKVLNFPSDTLTQGLRSTTADILAVTAGGLITISPVPVDPVAGDRFTVT